MTCCYQEENSCLDQRHPSSPASLPATQPNPSLLWAVVFSGHEKGRIIFACLLFHCFSVLKQLTGRVCRASQPI